MTILHHAGPAGAGLLPNRISDGFALPVRAESIPSELRQLPRWLAWELRDRGRGKPAKVPISPASGRPADVTDRRDCGTFAAALAVYRAGRAAGIGFALFDDDPYTAADLDGCVARGGAVEPWAAELVGQLDSYSEYSPSGTGVRGVVRGKTDPRGPCRRGSVELYSRSRFVTLTGRKLPESPAGVFDRQAELTRLQQALRREPPRPIQPGRRVFEVGETDEELIRLATAAKNGEKFTKLWAGNWGGYRSPSEADSALAALLLFWAGGDLGRADRLFRASALARPKWDSRRAGGTYGSVTLARAADRLLGVRSPRRASTRRPAQPDPAPSLESHDVSPHLWSKDVSAAEGAEVPAVVRRAFASAASSPAVDDLAARLGGRDAAVLALACLDLERFTGGTPHFLSCRTAATALRVGKTRAAGLLRDLVARGALVVVAPGTHRSRRATEYRVGPALRS